MSLMHAAADAEQSSPGGAAPRHRHFALLASTAATIRLWLWAASAELSQGWIARLRAQ